MLRSRLLAYLVPVYLSLGFFGSYALADYTINYDTAYSGMAQSCEHRMAQHNIQCWEAQIVCLDAYFDCFASQFQCELTDENQTLTMTCSEDPFGPCGQSVQLALNDYQQQNNPDDCPPEQNPASSINQSGCGNLVIELNEDCDDGNREGGDGCPANCGKLAQEAVCGDGILDQGEACDAGSQNGEASSSCNAQCQVSQADDDGLENSPQDNGDTSSANSCNLSKGNPANPTYLTLWLMLISIFTFWKAALLNHKPK